MGHYLLGPPCSVCFVAVQKDRTDRTHLTNGIDRRRRVAGGADGLGYHCQPGAPADDLGFHPQPTGERPPSIGDISGFAAARSGEHTSGSSFGIG